MLAHVTIQDDKKPKRRIFGKKFMKKLDFKLAFKLELQVII